MPTKIFAAAGLVALLTGCATVGPDFKVPAAPTMAGFAMAADAAPKIDTTAHPSGAWWTAFGSSQLDAVMAQALKGNQTLAKANATLERAKEDYNVLEDLRTPHVDGTAGAMHERINIKAFGLADGLPISKIRSRRSIRPSLAFPMISTCTALVVAVARPVGRGSSGTLIRQMPPTWP